MKIKAKKFNYLTYKFGTISLCMIMKNEEKNLARCLNSVRGLVNEIVIVDTGSSDNSINIAKSFGAKVFEQAWQDDFSAPRNLGIRNATCDFIFVLDPDEVFLKKDFQALRNLTNDPKYKAFQLITKNYGRNTMELGFQSLKGLTDPTGEFKGYVPSTKTRFFKNGLGIEFQGVWHELADYYVSQHKIPVIKKSIFIHHWFHEISQTNRLSKLKFYMRLGEKKVMQQPLFGQAWWELAVSYAIAGYRYKAKDCLLKAFNLGFGGHNQFFTLSRILRMTNSEAKANLAFEKGICRLYKNLTHISPAHRSLAGLQD